MSTPLESTERAFELLTRHARGLTPLEGEWEGSLQDFFGSRLPSGDAASTLLHARRHLEWFLLERHSPALFGVPAERLLPSWRAAVAEAGLEEASLEGVLESFCGAFQVTGLAEDGAWLRDLAGLGDYILNNPARALKVGDLLIGRLYPSAGGVHHPSPGVKVIRDESLALAIQRDLDQARSDGAKILHFSQLELERLFFATEVAQAAHQTDPVQEARASLAAEGLGADQVEAILERLHASPFDPARLVTGAGDALGAILEELAFETQVDLERARSALTSAWAHMAKPAPRQPSAAPEQDRSDPSAALDRFDSGRAAGGELDELFGQLERDLQLEGAADAQDAGEHSPAPDFPGVVGAMLDEFRWEVEQAEGAESAGRHGVLAPLGEYAARLGRFEELDATELLRFTTFWLPERAELAGDQARELLASLSAFCTWAEQAHEMPLDKEFSPTLDRLTESLPRILELNRSLPQPPKDEPGHLFEVVADKSGRFSGLVDREGNHHTAVMEAPLAARLRPGDRLRGSLDLEGRLALYRCYPPEAAGLLSP